MRALGALLGAAALIAEAGWRSTTVGGTPRDVVAVDAGVCVVAATGAGAGATVVAGTSALGIGPGISNLAAQQVSAVLKPGNCLVGIIAGSNNLTFGGPGCPVPSYSFPASGASGGLRLRSTPTGALWAYCYQTSTVAVLRRAAADAGSNPMSGSADWASLSGSDVTVPSAPLAALSLATGAEYLAWASLGALSAPTLHIAIDGGLASAFTGFEVVDVSLFENGNTVGAVVATDAGALQVCGAVLDGGFNKVALPPLAFSSVSFTTAQGSANGRGFGMAVANDKIYSPVPNPAAPGVEWVLRTTDAGFSGRLVRVSCADPTYCALIANVAGVGTPNVWAYFNDSAPVAGPTAASVQAGGVTDFFLDAGDDDGDPIWITWSGSNAYWDGGDPRFIQLRAPAACTAVASSVQAVLSDGYGPHDRTIPISINVVGGMSALPPVVTPAGGLTLTAGGSARTATAAPVDGGCALGMVSWFLDSDAGFLLAASGSGVGVKPPAFWCSPDAGVFALTATASTGLDASTQIPVVLEPWGNPFAPVFSPTSVQQLAGSAASYTPDASSAHFCALAPTQLRWAADAGGVPGVTFAPTPTQLTVSSTDECAGGTLWATATREVTSLPAQASPPSTLVVELKPNLQPVATSTLDIGFSYAPATSVASGVFSVPGLNCLPSRGLHATVLISRLDGGVVADAGNSVPGSWSVSVDACSGGDYLVVATLTDDGGTPLGLAAPPIRFSTAQVIATVAFADSQTEAAVSCETGASATLAVTPAACPGEDFLWTQIGGPALTEPVLHGSKVTFHLAPGQLQASAGEKVSWHVEATIAPGNVATATRTLELVPKRFVEITHTTDAPIAREEEAVAMKVTLKNTTACAVSGLDLHEAFGGLQPIDGTVRLDGKRIAARFDRARGFIDVEGVALEAGGSASLTYAARVPLLAAAHPSAEIHMKGSDVTLSPTLPVAGCGCDSAAAGTLGLLVFGGGLVRSRRPSG